jgi:hypothetical protein
VSTTVANKHYEPYDIYIGRPSKWGNPFRLGPDGPRGVCVEKYAAWVVKQPDLMAALPELKDKTLGCWCSPRSCHGHVLAALADEL